MIWTRVVFLEQGCCAPRWSGYLHQAYTQVGEVFHPMSFPSCVRGRMDTNGHFQIEGAAGSCASHRIASNRIALAASSPGPTPFLLGSGGNILRDRVDHVHTPLPNCDPKVTTLSTANLLSGRHDTEVRDDADKSTELKDCRVVLPQMNGQRGETNRL